MPKKQITDEEKIKIIEAYIRGEIGFGQIKNRYGVPKSTLRHWIERYRAFGADGLVQRKHNHAYSTETKKCAVEEYLSGKGSYKDICKNTKFTQINSCVIGLRCIIVIENYAPPEAEGEISI